VSALSFSDVSVALGGRTVLADVGFDIEQGEFVGMLGANGSGKTTLMRAALGLVPLAHGEIRVLGQPAMRGNPGVGYMPQLRGNVAGLRLTGWDLVATAAGGGRWGLPRLSRDERRAAEEAIEMVGATELARRPLAELSGGERQRLLLSQALIGRPRLVFLDEPLVSLDPAHQRGVIDTVKQLRDAFGMTFVFSAHELNPLLNAIDRVLYLGKGKAVLGTVDEVITGPVLSRLYGSEIEVVRLNGRIFVMAGDVEVEREAHRHDHDHDGHEHGAASHA
jgi:zinc/manganese transport system ATP-binding protein